MKHLKKFNEKAAAKKAPRRSDAAILYDGQDILHYCWNILNDTVSKSIDNIKEFYRIPSNENTQVLPYILLGDGHHIYDDNVYRLSSLMCSEMTIESIVESVKNKNIVADKIDMVSLCELQDERRSIERDDMVIIVTTRERRNQSVLKVIEGKAELYSTGGSGDEYYIRYNNGDYLLSDAVLVVKSETYNDFVLR